MYTKKDLLRLFIPAFIEQLLSTAIGVVNTMMVSGVGAYAVSGVGIVDSINIVAMNLFMAVSTGATVVISQHLGAGRNKEASKTAAQSISAVLLLSTLTGLGLYLLGEPIINSLFGNAEQIVKSAAKTYLVCSAISYPFLGLFNVFTGILRANNNFRASMVAAVASNIINVTVGAVCIFNLNLGVLGAGIGMISARILGTLMLIHPLFTDNKIGISGESYKITFKILKPVLYIGVPAGLDSIVFNGGKLLVQTFITSLGTAALAANTVASSVNMLINIPGSAVTIVSVSVIGCYAGAGLRDDLRKMIMRLTLYSMALLSVVSLVFFPFIKSFIGLYQPTEDVLKMALHVTYLTLVCIPLFWSAGFIVPACLRSSGDSGFVTIVSISSMWIIRVLCGYILMKYTSLGLMGIWIAWCFDWITRGVPYCLRVLSRKYEKYLPKVEA